MRQHKAAEEGIAVIENIMGNPYKIDYDLFPIVVHSHPAISFIGASAEKLFENNIPYKTCYFPMSGNSKAHSLGNTVGFVKILACNRTNKILGVHIISDIAEEQIAQAVLCLSRNLTVDKLAKMSFAHPTMGEAIKEAAAYCFDKKSIF